MKDNMLNLYNDKRFNLKQKKNQSTLDPVNPDPLNF